MSDEDDYPTAAEQRAFSEAEDLAARLRREMGYDQGEIGKGLLVSALSQLRKSIGNEATAELLYQAADDYAVRQN
jgi:hypothetical protein